MLEFLHSSPDVMALRIGGKINGAQLEEIMDRLELLLAAEGPIHLFVETHTVTGIAIDGLAHYAARALPLLGQLGKFGRVAIVADQAWIRIASRIESAILPGISYAVYTPDRRDEALAWVEQGG